MFTNDGKWVIDQNNLLYPVALALSRLYETIHKFSWTAIVPIFFALAIFSAIIVVNRGQRHYMGRPTGMYDVVKKLFIRLLFLVVGVPLLGSTYSAALDGIEGALSGDQKGTFAAKVIASTFVDFESWAANTNLNPPNDAVLYTTIMRDGSGHVTFRPASGSYSSLRTTCLAINKSTGVLKSAFSGFSVTENTDAGTDAGLSYNTDNSYQSGLVKNGEAKYKSHSRSMSETEVVYDILNRYTQSYFYHRLIMRLIVRQLTVSLIVKHGKSGLSILKNGIVGMTLSLLMTLKCRRLVIPSCLMAVLVVQRIIQQDMHMIRQVWVICMTSVVLLRQVKVYLIYQCITICLQIFLHLHLNVILISNRLQVL